MRAPDRFDAPTGVTEMTPKVWVDRRGDEVDRVERVVGFGAEGGAPGVSNGAGGGNRKQSRLCRGEEPDSAAEAFDLSDVAVGAVVIGRGS